MLFIFPISVVCHAINITFQTIPKRELCELLGYLSGKSRNSTLEFFNDSN